MKIISDPSLQEKFYKETGYLDLFESDARSFTLLVSFEKDEFIIQEGRESKYLFFMTSGQVHYYSISNNGRIIPFGAANSFRVFGEVASLWGMSPNVSVQATEKTCCLAIELAKYRETLMNDNRFLRYICHILSERITLLNDNMVSYSSSGAISRLSAFIQQNADERGMLTCSLAVCSEALGVSYRQIIRIMNSLCSRRILKKEKRHYFIIDDNALSELSSDTYVYYD